MTNSSDTTKKWLMGCGIGCGVVILILAILMLSDAKNAEEIEVKTPRNVFKMIRLGFGLVPQIADFFKGRNQALLDEGMGMGEYYYIYVIGYYSWLGKKPEDGPDFQFIDREGEYNYDLLDEEEVREGRRERILRRLHRQILPMLKNQYAKLTESNVSGVLDKWWEVLAAEIKAMEEDRERLPWQDGLPENLRASFRPFRERLEESYNEMTNPLEVILEQR